MEGLLNRQSKVKLPFRLSDTVNHKYPLGTSAASRTMRLRLAVTLRVFVCLTVSVTWVGVFVVVFRTIFVSSLWYLALILIPAPIPALHASVVLGAYAAPPIPRTSPQKTLELLIYSILTIQVMVACVNSKMAKYATCSG